MRGSLFVKMIAVSIIVAVYSAIPLYAENGDQSRRHFLGSTFLMLFNFSADPPDYYQLNYGYGITDRDVLLIDLMTWKMSSPKGVPYGPSFDSADEEYPGYVREFGVSIGYQRFLWRGLSASIHAAPIFQSYYDENEAGSRNGFQLFTSLRIGYHFSFFKGRFFIEPTLGFNYWPLTVNEPDSFREVDDRWPNYFLFDPNLLFGFRL